MEPIGSISEAPVDWRLGRLLRTQQRLQTGWRQHMLYAKHPKRSLVSAAKGGLRGVQFIHAAVESSRQNAPWMQIKILRVTRFTSFPLQSQDGQ
jgi:hypothetical protein